MAWIKDFECISLLYVAGTPYVTDCVVAELEKLGTKYRLALRFELSHLFLSGFITGSRGMGPRLLLLSLCGSRRVSRDPRVERLACLHKGTYADDCLLSRVQQHRCFIVATCDKGLKQRIRHVPGVPIMFISKHRCVRLVCTYNNVLCVVLVIILE